MRHHRPVATCDGEQCSPDCHFRRLIATEPEKWEAYLDPARPAVPQSVLPSVKEPCRHLGAATGERIDCPSCAGNVQLKTFACAVHGSCTTNKSAPGVACCNGCPEYSTADEQLDPNAIYVEVEPHSTGLGDHAVNLLAAAGLQQANPGRRVVLRTSRSDCAAWMRLWWRDVTLSLPPGAATIRPLEERPLGRRSLSRWEHAARRAGVRLAIPPLVSPLPAEAVRAAWSLQGSVVLCPEANSDDRPWPLAAWMDLEQRLLDRGFRCVVLGTHAGSLTRFQSQPYVGQEAARVAALLRMAACVIGNDSGMAHVAGLLGTPAVALCGLVGGERVFGGYRTVRWIDGPLHCNGCEWVDPERQRYGCQRCASLDAIAPAQVMGVVEELTCRRAWDYTLLPPGPRASLQRAARETAELPGAMAELGVRRGGGALIMASAAHGKHINLFDTFAGMPCDDPDGGNNDKGKHAAARSSVECLFRCAGIGDFSIWEGVFPDSVPACLDGERYSCVHLDADHYAPTAAAISYFWPRMVLGGRIVFDDWRRGDCPGIERAVRERFTDGEIEDTAEYQCTVTKGV